MKGKGIRILATGRALPSELVTNEDMSAIVDTSDEWIRSRTGIRSRYRCGDGESCSTLAVEAAQKAFERSGLAAEDIGAVIVATSTPDYMFPSTACLVQKELGLGEEIFAFDLMAACTGFLYAIGVAQGLLNSMPGKYILAIGCEQLSRITDYSDRSTCILFGDGAGAAIIGAGDRIYVQKAWSRGNREVLSCLGPGKAYMQESASAQEIKDSSQHIHMLGNEVFRFAVTAMHQAIDSVLEEAGLTMEDVDLVVCHQANERIIRFVQKKYPGQEQKFFLNIAKYGNTSAASIPIALDEAREQGLIREGMKLLCVGFGAGLTWSGALIEL